MHRTAIVQRSKFLQLALYRTMLAPYPNWLEQRICGHVSSPAMGALPSGFYRGSAMHPVINEDG